MSILSFEDVSCSYPESGKAALSGFTLSVESGEFLALMGQAGSGKTTVCKLVNGIIPHAQGGRLTGQVLVDGIDTANSSVPALAETVGLVLDDPDAQLFTSSVRNEAAFGPENLNVPVSEIEERVAEALASVGLAGFEDRLPSTLSGGEKQRLVIASFLTMKSKILVLDDPLCRLDPEGAKRVMSVLKTLQTQHGIAIIMATHDSKAALEFADRVCILNEGKLIACDTAEKIFADKKLLEENGIEPPQEYDINSFFIHNTLCSSVSSVVLNSFSFAYENNIIINNLNLTIKDGDFTAIIGANGSGKTTLLKNIAGLLRPTSGDIFIHNKNTKEITTAEISKEIGFVMQNPDNQLFTESVYKEVSFALKNLKLNNKEIEVRVDNALNLAGLNDKDAFPHSLTRSDRRKAVIACVLAMGCKILLFDEVDVGEDYQGSIKIMDLAKELVSKGYTIIFVTHNMSLVCKYAHNLIVMEKDGSISEWKIR